MMSEKSSKGVAVGTGVVVVIILLALGIYWFFSNRPQKVVGRPLVVVGVGLYLSRDQETHKFQITKIFPNSPAEKAGLAPGLVLNKVDGVVAEQKNIKEVSLLLRGPVGSKVMVETVDANGATNAVEITREQFVNKSSAP